MTNGSIALLLALVPLPHLLAAMLIRWRSNASPREALRLADIAAICSFGAGLLAAVALWLAGPATGPVTGIAGIGMSFRLDALSVALSLLIGFVGIVVIRFSSAYLDGDPAQARFAGMLCTALGAVGLLVTAASLAQLVLAWIAMSLALHGLLVFRTERRGARLAARKKFLFARAGDICLVVAAVLLARAFGTLDIPSLNAAAQAAAEAGTMPPGAAGAAMLIAIAALLKSAQFPTHGWLIEVMETPTPVSALLHAGIVNAGGFLILRFADLMLATASALPLLLVVGALTAVIGALAALAQTSIKVSLAWSTVAQMGFMMLQCGLGAFSSAILHLLAHSLYKAHAFLEAGRTVERVDAGFASTRNADTREAPGLPMAILTLTSVLLVYGGAAWMLGFTPVQNPAALALGAVPMMGLWLAWISGPRSLRALRGLLPIAGGVMVLYFFLQMASARIFAGLLPTTQAPGLLGTALLAGVFGAFAAAVLLQACGPGRSSALLGALRVHLANGLYLNDVIDRLLGAYRLRSDTRH